MPFTFLLFTSCHPSNYIVNKKEIPELEFIALMAFLMSNVAIAIDAILPGLSEIGQSLNNTDATELQLIISMIVLGIGVGQLFFGSLSDSFGRKPIVYVGVGLFIVASIICLMATDMTTMLIGRILQGVGLSAPRSISMSIIRDSYMGNHMARIMSFVSVFFILVPMFAPILGQLTLTYFNWEAIFIFQMFFILLIITWFAIRQKETLSKENKVAFTASLFINGTKEFFRHRPTIVYTLIAGLMSGAFLTYLSASSHIFQEQYGRKEEFAYIFGALALTMGASTFMNGKLVLRYGAKKLANIALYVFIFSSLIYSISFFNSGNPNLFVLLFFLSLQFMSLGFVFGNVNALAMEPIGHIAGIGAALNGFFKTVLAVPITILIGNFIDASALPLFVGFLVCGVLSYLLTIFAKSKSNPT